MDSAAILAEIPRLRRYARALLGDRAAADDLVQDTLERAWSRHALWRAGSDRHIYATDAAWTMQALIEDRTPAISRATCRLL